MKRIISILSIILIFSSCQKSKKVSVENKTNWESRKVHAMQVDSMILGKTYLPVYSHIYHIQEHKTFDLTATISMRNVSTTDTVYILKAEYFNTAGAKVRDYLRFPIFLKPLETVEIIIAESDKEGGSGANFIFDWAVSNDKNPPLFESVMISTYGQQGLSFSSRGVRIYD